MTTYHVASWRRYPPEELFGGRTIIVTITPRDRMWWTSLPIRMYRRVSWWFYMLMHPAEALLLASYRASRALSRLIKALRMHVEAKRNGTHREWKG